MPLDDEQTDKARKALSQLKKLTDELSTLLRPQDADTDMPGNAPLGASNEDELIDSILRIRRVRNRIFADVIFSDPQWDILLNLYRRRNEEKQDTISSVCALSGVPPTTALRWLTHLESLGLVTREADATDARRTFIRLSEKATGEMAAMFGEIRGFAS